MRRAGNDLPDDERVGEAMSLALHVSPWPGRTTSVLKLTMPKRFRFVHVHQRCTVGPTLSSTLAVAKIQTKEGVLASAISRNSAVQSSIDEYCDTLLQWLNQLSSNLGSGLPPRTTDCLDVGGKLIFYERRSKSGLFKGKARPQLPASFRHGGKHQGPLWTASPVKRFPTTAWPA